MKPRPRPLTTTAESERKNSIAHREGRRAFQGGQVDADCPYESCSGAAQQRVHWFNGYLEARYEPLHKRLDALLERFRAAGRVSA